ncbi:longevity-assurance protein [Ophiostoma piceae UAMH 11346]|uniref:Longevity-assurance protein n=1 Tax=Ophiostoma piceae (strain UAMH 11346) TaxID=1262450 RepID=S3C5F4_OPHP1|nr:longevity-assurance protein [Ophiostoma piceae UAMH 11346]
MASTASRSRPTGVPLPPHAKQAAPTASGSSSFNGSSSTKNGVATPVYNMQTSNVVLVRRLKRKQTTPMKQFTRWLVENQTGLAANLFALLFLAHSLFPRLRQHTVKFFTLAYLNEETGKHNIGKDDAYLVLFLVVLFSGLRASTMDYILSPFARSQGLYKKKPITRFSEQAWLVIVYMFFYPFGCYLYYNSPYFLNMENLWVHWPGREMPGQLKAYLLIQLAFWLQQIIVINIEERRKDHWQMLTHHFITVSLITASYRYRLTPVANVILILMDVSDIFLPLAKCQKYLGYTTICDVTFGAFMLSWFICRHIFYPMICYSVWKHTPKVITFGCYKGLGGIGASPTSVRVGPNETSTLFGAVSKAAPFFSDATNNRLAFLIEPMLDSEGAICYDSVVKWMFLSMLLFLQLIIIMWFFMIVQVAIRVVRGSGADDTRSDGEDEDEEEEADSETDGKNSAKDEFVFEEAQALEEEVGVESIDLKGWERRTGVKRQTSASTGVSLPGHHSDRKELLGRIGCEKQVD